MKWILVPIAFFVFISISFSLAFDLSPENPIPGQEVVLTGTAKPMEEITFQSRFSMNLPVTNGEYGYETAVQVPQKPNRFTISANNLQDFNAGVKFGIWITKSFRVSGGTIRISQSDVPPGRYNLKMFGKALPGSTQVPVNIEAQTQVQADNAGKYELIIDTSGIPAGDYFVTGAGEAKTIRLGDGSAAVSSSINDKEMDNNGASSKERVKNPVAINREIVEWYADQIGLEIKNSSQYNQAEDLLNKRLSGGYWKVIAQGEPLTEEAGDCLQKYCLVRGVDACDVCREKDIILKGGQPSLQSSRNGTNFPGLSGNRSSPQSGTIPQRNSFLSTLANWIARLGSILS